MNLSELHNRYWAAMLCLKRQTRQIRQKDFLASERTNTLAWHLNLCSVALSYAERHEDPAVALEWAMPFIAEAQRQHSERHTRQTHRICAIYRALQWDMARLQRSLKIAPVSS